MAMDSTLGLSLVLLFVCLQGGIVNAVSAVCKQPGELRNVTLRTVCYPDVGCFDDSPPFNNAKGSLPRSPQYLNVGLRLFTRLNPTSYQLLSYVNSSVTAASNFKSTRKTKFVIHGFINTGDEPWVNELKDALLKKGDFNVITVDWGNGAKAPYYDQAVANLRLVGTQVMLLLNILQGQGLRLDDVHMIGHSLGAHMSGYVGLLTGSAIGRISGLDPAEPDFECLPSLVRLDKGDAIFVDIIHTNGGSLLDGGAGMYQMCGHVDFFVNGGMKQPGCKNGLGGILDSIMGKDSGVACSHGRSHVYFTESINTDCSFLGIPCESYAKFQRGECTGCPGNGCSSMGYDADQFFGTGAMFLSTRKSAPFCGYQYMVNVTMHNSAGKNTQGALNIALHGAYGNSSLVQITPDTETYLYKGHSVSGIVIVESEVGPLKSISVVYMKKPTSWHDWWGGEKSVFIGSVNAVSTETGMSYQFCEAKYEAKHGEYLEIFSKDHISCKN